MPKATSDDSPTISVVLDGRTHTVRHSDCSALDATACRQATGLSLRGLFAAAATDPDLDVIAAVVWLGRRHSGEPDLTYDTVARELTYGSDFEIVEADAEADDPEA